MEFCAYNKSRCGTNTWSGLEEYNQGGLAGAEYIIPVVYPDEFC